MRKPDERALPMSLEAERSILGAALLDAAALGQAEPVLDSTDFFSRANQEIFDAMLALRDQGEPIEPVTLREELQRRQVFEIAGGNAYVASLVDGLPHSVNVDAYARIVKEKSCRRQVIRVAHSAVKSGMGDGETTASIIEHLQGAVNDIALDLGIGAKRGDERTIMEMLAGEVKGRIKFGLPYFDRLVGGFPRGDIMTMMAVPKAGKTALLLQALYALLESNPTAAILFASLDMQPRQVFSRHVQQIGKVTWEQIVDYVKEREPWPDCLVEHVQRLEAMRERRYVVRSDIRSVADIAAAARQMDPAPDVIAIDYLQLLRRRGVTRETDRVTENLPDLKGLAVDIDAAVLLLSQITRADNEPDRCPPPDAGRGGSAIEAESAMTMGLWKPDFVEDLREERRVVKVKARLTLNRVGPLRSADLEFDGPCLSFGEWSEI